MNRIIVSVITVFLLLTPLFQGCGGGVSIQDELGMVPGLCFLHVHISCNMDIKLIPEEVNEFIPLWLCDSLNVRGDFGVSLLGVNLTDFTPQLLFLSRELGTDEMLQLGRTAFNCGSRENRQGYDLIDERGSMIGSIAGRDGWTCLITGSGSDRSARRWLELEKEESLASDSDLISISESDADLTILISHNSIAFVSVIPTGMLSRAQIGILNRVKDLIGAINPKALRVTLNISNEEPPLILLELQLVRNGSNVTSFSVSFSDTEFTSTDLVQLIRDGGFLF
ncbi:MAG: hypothetical protein GQ565_05860 [Candidatus Aegiribacteria sp.]|nr:hypothetical protein [Candidatus Aegiribacteria sp.]